MVNEFQNRKHLAFSFFAGGFDFEDDHTKKKGTYLDGKIYYE